MLNKKEFKLSTVTTCISLAILMCSIGMASQNMVIDTGVINHSVLGNGDSSDHGKKSFLLDPCNNKLTLLGTDSQVLLFSHKVVNIK